MSHNSTPFKPKNLEEFIAKSNRCLVKLGEQMMNKCKRNLGQTNKLAVSIGGVKRTLEVSEARYGRIIQKWQKAFTPRASMEIKPQCIDICKIKIDVLLCPSEYDQHHYLGLMQEAGSNPYAYGFHQYLIDNLLYQIQEDKQYVSDIFSVTPTSLMPNKPGSAWLSGDGLFSNIWKLYQKGDITPIPTGKITKENICAQVDLMVKNVHRCLKGKPARLYLSCENYIKYCEAKFEKYYQSDNVYVDLLSMNGRRTPNSNLRPFMIPHSNVMMCPLESIDYEYPNDAMILIGEGNLVNVYDEMSDDTTLYFEKDKRSICIFGDMKRGQGFICPDERFILTNDQVPNPYLIPLPEEELEYEITRPDNPFTIAVNEQLGAAA